MGDGGQSTLDTAGVLRLTGRICVLRVGDLIHWYFPKPMGLDIIYIWAQRRCIVI